MGKIKRERQKFHITAESQGDVKMDVKEAPKRKPLKAQLDAVENIFAGINIQLDNINKFEELPPPPPEPKQTVQKIVVPDVTQDDDNKSTILQKVGGNDSKASGKQLTKKEKMALRHQKLMEKLDVTQKARLQSKKKKQKGKSKALETSILESTKEVKSLLTPAAVKSSNPTNNTEKTPKNIFALPSFKDDLPALNSAFELKGNSSKNKLNDKSKSIGKKNNTKKSFVNNYNFLRKAMNAKKQK